jgi:DNA-binding GntR family transcriptional regulator
MLVSMEIAPGERIGIDAVARRLGISQTPVREALNRLEAEKLVTKVPNVGYRATSRMSLDEARDLYEMRLLVEPFAAARAAERMDDASLRILARMEKAAPHALPGSGGDYARFAEADATLHRLIANSSGNRLIAESIERLHVHLHIFRSLYRTNAPEEAAKEHKVLLRALLERDAVRAEQAMRTHLQRSLDRMERAAATFGEVGAPKSSKRRTRGVR